MKRTKMISAGHICIDITPAFRCGPVRRPGDLLAPGKLIAVGESDVHTGGSAANTGLAMKKFGADVSIMGKIGDDPFGKLILDILKGYGADGDMIIDPASSTSSSIVLAIPGVDRIFLHNAGANDTFTADDIRYDACRQAALFHFGYPPIMKRMYECGGTQLEEMFRRVKAQGCITSLDMAAMDPSSEAAQQDWNVILSRTLPYVDFFLPSIEEVLFALDRDRYDALQARAQVQDADVTSVLDLESDVLPMAERLLDMGCKAVLLKCGAPGFWYQTAGAEAFDALRREAPECGIDFTGFSDRRGFERSYVPERIISGTGAGDVTIGAFLTAVVQGYPFDMCLHLAAGAGACCVSAPDAVSGLKTFPEMEEMMRRGWRKNA